MGVVLGKMTEMALLPSTLLCFLWLCQVVKGGFNKTGLFWPVLGPWRH